MQAIKEKLQKLDIKNKLDILTTVAEDIPSNDSCRASACDSISWSELSLLLPSP